MRIDLRRAVLRRASAIPRAWLAAVVAPVAAGLAHAAPSPAPSAPPQLDATGLDGLRVAYEDARHRVVERADGSHRARTHAQGFATTFDGRGAAVAPDHGAWSFGLELEAFGRVGAVVPLAERPRVEFDDRRITYAWSASLTEWWINRDHGLEHGFTVTRRVDGEGPLVVALRVRGELQPVIDADGRGASFRGADGRVALTYAGLAVFDATGAALSACMNLRDGRLEIEVDDAGALHPIVIDPLIQQPGVAPLAGGLDRSGDEFGTSVAICGDTAVVGAPREESGASQVDGDQTDDSVNSAGAAYVFVRSGGVWRQDAYLKVPSTQAGFSFGSAVDVCSDTIVVGAPGESSDANGVDGDQSDQGAAGAGAAFVFVRVDGAWTQQGYLKALNSEPFDDFGRAVAISGDTIVVGAPDHTQSLKGGAAFVFERFGGAWYAGPRLVQSGIGLSDEFGASVAIDGDTIVVGRPFESSPSTGVNGDELPTSAPSSGAAYVFTRGTGLWSQQAYLKASNTGAGDLFGSSVAIHGDRIVVGAPREDGGGFGVDGDDADDSVTNAGACYLFERDGTAWSFTAYLKPTVTASAEFGKAVAIDGDTVAAGAPLDGAGAIEVFVHGAGGWAHAARLEASNAGPADLFGAAVAISGDTILVGASDEDGSAAGIDGVGSDTQFQSGAAYAFDRSGTAWTQAAYLKASGSNRGDGFGSALALSGATLVVGAPFEDSGADGVGGDPASDTATDAGAAYVFVESGGAWTFEAYLKASDSGVGDRFGTAVAIDGDTIVVGAPAANGGGAAYAFERVGGAWSEEARLVASNADPLDRFGRAVAVSGTTIVVGADGEDGGSSGLAADPLSNDAIEAGAAYVFARSAGAWSEVAYLKASNPGPGDRFGGAVALDGPMLVVGARGEDSASTGVDGDGSGDAAVDAGAAYAFVRTGTVWSQEAYLKASNTGAGDRFGAAVAASGARVAIGAPSESGSSVGVGGDDTNDDAPSAGAVFVFVRSGGAWSQEVYAKASNTDALDRFGVAVALDGVRLLVGADGEDGGASGEIVDGADDSTPDAGAAYLFERGAIGWAPAGSAKGPSPDPFDGFGRAVALDGALVAVGAPLEDGVAGGTAGNDGDPDAGGAHAFRIADWFEVVGCGANSASWILPSAPARVGEIASVDLVGAAVVDGVAAIYFGVSALDAVTGCGAPLAGGELLLGLAPFPELLGMPPVVGGVATQAVPVPPTPSLAGVRLALQAALFDGVTSAAELSTALEFEIRP